ncbi:MAG: radical SAM protein [Candidatus Latescibacteria bacterium]|nr:radical SAM protein [Candidatus Latescibacterota bacterium]
MFDAPRPVVESFLDGYLSGDGHRTDAGKTSCTTVSEDLAWGIAWLALKLGHFPALYANEVKPGRTIEGRTVHAQPRQHSVVWYGDNAARRRLTEVEGHYLIPILSVNREPYDGEVYNLEVEGEHDYLASLFLAKNCQNYITSQALRDPDAIAPPRDITPAQFVALAKQHGARVVTSTYNEPLITSEWAVAIFQEARQAGLICSYVSNGNGTPEVLDYIRPYVDLYKVDLKSFDDKHYRKLGGTLQSILDTIRMLHDRGFWVEIVTLLIPGFNDSDAEVRDLTRFLVSVSPDIPWHVTAFHKDYRMQDPENTSPRALVHAAEIGRREGLRYVYAGNLPGLVGDFENTRCPACDALLIERHGYRILRNRIEAGACYACRTPIPGRWDSSGEEGRLSDAPVPIRLPKPNA